MKVYTYSQARQNLADILNQAKRGKVVIRRRGGDSFVIVPQVREGSPFDVSGVKTGVDTADILAAVKETRTRPGR